jgi:hypothetical protein
MSMASKDRVAALRIPPAPERRIGFLLGGRDARLLLVAIGALLGRPEAALAAIALTSGLSLAVRLLLGPPFGRGPKRRKVDVRGRVTRRPPHRDECRVLAGVA